MPDRKGCLINNNLCDGSDSNSGSDTQAVPPPPLLHTATTQDNVSGRLGGDNVSDMLGGDNVSGRLGGDNVSCRS